MKNTSKINPLKKVIPCLLGMMISMMYSCEDDNDNLSKMEQLVDKIAQMREQMSKLAESLEKRKKTTEAMSEAAEALKQAASQSSSSSTSEALRTAAKAIQTAASALLTGSKKSALLEAAKALAAAAKDKDEGKDEEASKKMEKALELMKKAMKGESTQEEASEMTKASEKTLTVKTVKDFYAPLNKRYVKSPPKEGFSFAEIFWFQIDTFTKFDFATGKQVDKDSNEWDFALAGNIMIINGGQKMHDVCDHPERFTRAIGPHEIPPMTKEECKVDEVQPDRTGNAAIYFVDDYNFDEIKDAEKDLAKSEAKKWTQDSTEELALDKLDVALFTFTHSGYHYYPMDGTLVFRTRDGKHYAKVKMISCVRSGKSSDVTKQEERTDAMCYTFKYAYNASESTDLDTSSTPSYNKKEQPTEHQLIVEPL